MLHRSAIIVFIVALLGLPVVAQDDEEVTLRIGHVFTSSLPLDPNIGLDIGAFFYYDLMYEGLIGIDAEGNLVPRLATDWEVTDEAITLTLRDGVTFSDGVVFDAEAAKANFDRFLTGGSRLLQKHLANVESVDVLDDLTIRLNLSQRDEFLLERLAGFAGLMVSPDAFETAAINPIGAGPYILNIEESIEDSYLVLERHENYWDVESLVADRIEIRIVPAPDVINGLLSGDQDIIFTISGLSGLIPADQFEVRSARSTIYGVMFWDREGTIAPELANQEVRCALSAAMDTEAYTTQIEGAIAEPIYHMPPEGWYGHNPDAPITTYDLEAARAMLEAAGVTNLRIETGFTPTTRARSEAFIGFMNDLGIEIIGEARNIDEYFQVTGGSEYAVTALPFSIESFIDFVETYFLENGSANPFNAVDEDIVALYEQAQELTLAEAEPIYQQISALIMERCYIKPLSLSSIAIAFRPGVSADLRYRTNSHLDMRTLSIDE